MGKAMENTRNLTEHMNRYTWEKVAVTQSMPTTFLYFRGLGGA